MEFAEVREYQAGDDIRFIDWNVSSRMGKLFVKQFVEERELTVILAIDLSASLSFLSQTKSKKELIAEISAIIAFTANLNNDKVGLLLLPTVSNDLSHPKKEKPTSCASSGKSSPMNRKEKALPLKRDWST